MTFRAETFWSSGWDEKEGDNSWRGVPTGRAAWWKVRIARIHHRDPVCRDGHPSTATLTSPHAKRTEGNSGQNCLTACRRAGGMGPFTVDRLRLALALRFQSQCWQHPLAPNCGCGRDWVLPRWKERETGAVSMSFPLVTGSYQVPLSHPQVFLPQKLDLCRLFCGFRACPSGASTASSLLSTNGAATEQREVGRCRQSILPSCSRHTRSVWPLCSRAQESGCTKASRFVATSPWTTGSDPAPLPDLRSDAKI